jgi:DNA-binding transcriptional LysR family regulator
MKFTLRQFGYFVAAAETGSITLGARRERISQPAISTAISHIERELDVQLFLRHHAQGLSLTSARRALLREARHLKQAVRPGRRRLRESAMMARHVRRVLPPFPFHFRL